MSDDKQPGTDAPKRANTCEVQPWCALPLGHENECSPIVLRSVREADDAALEISIPMPARAGGIPKSAGGTGRRPRGRPLLLTPELQEKICGALRAGNYMETAAAFAGVNKDTLYDWLKKGALSTRSKKHELYRRFSDAVERAQAEAETRSVALISRAAASQWQAAAWHLERTKPHRYGRRVLEVQGQDGGAVRVALDGDDLLSTLKRLAGGESSLSPKPTDSDTDIPEK